MGEVKRSGLFPPRHYGDDDRKALCEIDDLLYQLVAIKGTYACPQASQEASTGIFDDSKPLVELVGRNYTPTPGLKRPELTCPSNRYSIKSEIKN